jgi:CRP-like cAMP-binding protein
MKKITNISKLKLLEFLNRIPLFKNLDANDRRTVSNIPDLVVMIEKGNAFIKQNQLDSDFYILLNGEAEVTVNKQFIATTTPGNFIGEVGFICNEARSATVTAKTDIIALRVTRDLFDMLPLKVRESIKQKIINGLVDRVSSQNVKIIKLVEQVDTLELKLDPDRDKQPEPENTNNDDGIAHVLNIKKR